MSGIMLCFFFISHFCSTVCSDTMAKRSQHDSGEERVTAKSRPMMSLIARAPSHVSSSTSFSKPGEKKLWKSRFLKYNCTERGAIRATWCQHRPNESFRTLLSWAIYGKLLFSKLHKVGWRSCLVFSRVDKWYWDVLAIGDLIKLLGRRYEKFDLVTRKFLSTELCNP